MATSIPPFFHNFLSLLLLLLLHLGCLVSAPRRHHHHYYPASTFSKFKKKLNTSKTTIISFLKHLLSAPSVPISVPSTIPSPSSSTRSLRLNQETTPIQINPLFPVHELHPCPVCGEIFQTPALLQLHQSTKHPISELIDGENILRIIFRTGWPDRIKSPTVHKILKIHNGPKMLAQFEEYREFVKSKAASKNRAFKDERCIADGNELLRFHCTTFTCDLASTICNHQYCSTCGIIRAGFSAKMDGISTFPTSWRAHSSVPEDLEEDFRFLNVKRALIVCRVISGRVGCDPGLSGEDPGFDSLVGRGSGGFEEELLVFSPNAVLPCFVIVYTV